MNWPLGDGAPSLLSSNLPFLFFLLFIWDVETVLWSTVRSKWRTMLRAFHVETNVDQGGVWISFLEREILFGWVVSQPAKIHKMCGGNRPTLRPLHLWTSSSVLTQTCLHFLQRILTATARHITQPDHYLCCVRNHPSHHNHSFSDAEEVQSACNHWMRLEDGREIQNIGEMGEERCCLLSLNLFY